MATVKTCTKHVPGKERVNFWRISHGERGWISLGGREDQIFDGKHYGGAIVILPARRYYSLTLPFHILFASFC
jgi:hypothetical protein